MKIALHTETAQPLTAAQTAPATARCPSCGSLVTLRRRRCMDGTSVYFWRHPNNRNLNCNGRSRYSQ